MQVLHGLRRLVRASSTADNGKFWLETAVKGAGADSRVKEQTEMHNPGGHALRRDRPTSRLHCVRNVDRC